MNVPEYRSTKYPHEDSKRTILKSKNSKSAACSTPAPAQLIAKTFLSVRSVNPEDGFDSYSGSRRIRNLQVLTLRDCNCNRGRTYDSFCVRQS